MKIKLLDDRILVKPIQSDDKTKAGIIIPSMAKERPNEGIIEEVGTGTPDRPILVKKGERVFYGHHTGVEIMHEETSYLIMRQSDILAVL